MPTPMPIIATAAVVKSGMSMRLRTTRTSAMPVPIPNSAVPMGSPIASTEPNAMRRMTIAASNPIASLVPLIGSVANMSPPYSIVSPSTSTWSPSAVISSPASRRSSADRSAKFSSAYAMSSRPIWRWPSGL